MKRKRLSILSLIPFLAGCSHPVHHFIGDYGVLKQLNKDETFVICSMQDIHLSSASKLDIEFSYLEKVVFSKSELESHGSKVKPDLIVLNGDTFLSADEDVVKSFFKWIDKLNIPFAFSYGNHDLQGDYSETFIDKTVKKCKNSILRNPDDKITGNSNYFINIEDNNHELKWQIFIIDSNTYHGKDYDVVHDDQILWFKKNAQKGVPNVAYMHIPVEEFDEVWRMQYGAKIGYGVDKDGQGYYMGEPPCIGYCQTNLYETMQTKNTKAIIAGHDHINNTDWHYNKNDNGDIRLIYGEKTGCGIYHDVRIMGGTFITLKTDGTFDLLRTSVQYYTDEIVEIDNAYLEENMTLF